MEAMNTQQLENNMETFINPSPKKKPAVTCGGLKVGDKYKITGGKYKKYKSGTLVSINDVYSDVCIDSTELKKGTMSALNTLHSKVKNCYLLPFVGKTIEMPEAKDLLVVEDLDKYLADHPVHIPDDVDVLHKKLLASNEADKKEPEPEPSDDSQVEGTLEVSDTGEVVDNITEVLPSVEEALALRKENIALKKEVAGLKSAFCLWVTGGKSEIMWKLQAIKKILE